MSSPSHMVMNFCRRCGKPLTHKEGYTYVCPGGHTIFNNPPPTVGIFFVTDDGDVLLSERGIEPYKGELDAFGGFLGTGESFQDAAVRELREELGLEPDEYGELQFLISGVVDYPFEGENHKLVHAIFWSRLKTDRELTPADDVAAIRRYPIKDFDFSLLEHNSEIKEAVEALHQKFA